MRQPKNLVVAECDTNGVIVRERGGYAVAHFFWQVGAPGHAKFDAKEMATMFAKLINDIPLPTDKGFEEWGLEREK